MLSSSVRSTPLTIVLPTECGRVRIRRADRKKAQWELYSDHQGEFAQRVPAGAADYIVWAEPEDKHVPKAEVRVHPE